jgi:hypothetical protein
LIKQLIRKPALSILATVSRIFANIALLFLLSLQCNLYGQDTTAVRRMNPFYKSFKKTELLVGINWQGNTADKTHTLRYVEVGVARSLHDDSRHGPVSFGLYVSEEMYFGSNTTVFGTKLGSYLHGMLADFGLAMIYYTDFKKGNFKLRPEIGFGMGPVRLVVGFNVPTINNKAFELLRQNNLQISFQFLIPVAKKEYQRKGQHIFKTLFQKEKQ